MYLKVDNKESENYDVLDLNTKKTIPGVQEANDETGEFSCFLWDRKEEDYIYNKEKKEYVVFKFKGNIKLVKNE